jgi:hypothetical protein
MRNHIQPQSVTASDKAAKMGMWREREMDTKIQKKEKHTPPTI